METVFIHVRINVDLSASATDDHWGETIEKRPISYRAVDPWKVDDIPTTACEREPPVQVVGTVAYATEPAHTSQKPGDICRRNQSCPSGHSHQSEQPKTSIPLPRRQSQPPDVRTPWFGLARV